MRVALIGTTAGCVINFRGDLIRYLSGLGCLVYAFAIDYDAESSRRVEELGGIAVSYDLDRTGIAPVADIVSTLRLAKQLRALKLDLVFSYFTKPVIFATAAAKLAGVPRRVGMLEGLGHSFTQSPNGPSTSARLVKLVQLCLYSLTFPLLERLIVLNRDDAKELSAFRFLRCPQVSVLGGIGVDLTVFEQIPPSGRPAFIFVGRLLAEKGIFEYVDAARLLKARFPQAECYLLGAEDKSNPGSLSSGQLSELVKDGIVNYVGEVADVRPWLSKSSVFVLPSYREGVPKSTQEALATGRAVITTDVPGCRDTVVNGVNGFLVAPWSAQALFEKMAYFVVHPEAIFSMGRASRELAEKNFDVVKINEHLATLLLNTDANLNRPFK